MKAGWESCLVHFQRLHIMTPNVLSRLPLSVFLGPLMLTSGGKRGNCGSECESIAWVSTKLLCGTLRMGYLTEQLKIKKENQNFWLKTLLPLYFYQLSWTNDDTWAFTYLTSGVAMLATVSGRALGTTMLWLCCWDG